MSGDSAIETEGLEAVLERGRPGPRLHPAGRASRQLRGAAHAVAPGAGAGLGADVPPQRRRADGAAGPAGARAARAGAGDRRHGEHDPGARSAWSAARSWASWRTARRRVHRPVPAPFLGGAAAFPSGPFVLAATLGAPVFLFHGVRTGGGATASASRRSPSGSCCAGQRGRPTCGYVVHRYAAALERACRRASARNGSTSSRSGSTDDARRRPGAACCCCRSCAWPAPRPRLRRSRSQALMARLAAVPRAPRQLPRGAAVRRADRAAGEPRASCSIAGPTTWRR